MNTRIEMQQFSWSSILSKENQEEQKQDLRGPRNDKVWITPVFGQSVVNVSGEDAEAFLDAQLTIDIKNVKSKSLVPSGYCNPKGRLIATPHLMRGESSFNLLLPDDLVSEFISRISRFILRSKVTLSENHELATIGVIRNAGGEVETPESQESNIETLNVNSTQGLMLCPFESIEPFWAKATTIYSSSSHEHWELEDIRNGIVNVGNAVKEQFLPQMINLDKRDGVSFTKGCYPGQEIVARTKYLGSVKRRLCHFKSSKLINPGTPILNAGGSTCGTVCQTASNFQQNDAFEGLAVIHVNNINNETLTTSDSIAINDVTFI